MMRKPADAGGGIGGDFLKSLMDDLLTLRAMLAGWEAIKNSNPDDGESLIYGALDLVREMVEKYK